MRLCDNLLVTGTNAEAVDQFFVIIGPLSIKNLSYARKCIGMRIEYGKGFGYKLDQEEAINDLLRDFGLEDAKTTRVPIINDCCKLQSLDEELLDQVAEGGKPSIKSFQSLVGTLIWITRCTHRTSLSLYTRRQDRRTSRGCMIGRWKWGLLLFRINKDFKTSNEEHGERV